MLRLTFWASGELPKNQIKPLLQSGKKAPRKKEKIRCLSRLWRGRNAPIEAQNHQKTHRNNPKPNENLPAKTTRKTTEKEPKTTPKKTLPNPSKQHRERGLVKNQKRSPKPVKTKELSAK
jgi:hypothetical protein